MLDFCSSSCRSTDPVVSQNEITGPPSNDWSSEIEEIRVQLSQFTKLFNRHLLLQDDVSQLRNDSCMELSSRSSIIEGRINSALVQGHLGSGVSKRSAHHIPRTYYTNAYMSVGRGIPSVMLLSWMRRRLSIRCDIRVYL